MKRSVFIIMLFVGLMVFSITPEQIIDRLTFDALQQGKVRFEVYMPSSSDPVEYKVNILAVNPGDSLCPCDYLISWELPRNGKVSTGFSSYHNGDHFRYRDTRLQEYHYSEDPTPFSTDGGGVQKNAQFAELLPAFLAEKIKEILSDTTYVGNYDEKRAIFEGVRRMNGYDVLEYSYEFDPSTGMPIKSEFTYNPASISEQTVTAYYEWMTLDSQVPVIDEAFLQDRYGEVFDKYRTSNFRVENMRGNAIPSFSYDVVGSGRVVHSRGEADLDTPILLVFLDSKVGSTHATIEEVRNSVSSFPMAIKTVYVFAENNVPDGFNVDTGEFLLNGPQGLIRKCGVTVFPAFLLLNRDGTVAEVFLGTDADLSTNLSQSMMLLQ